MRVSHDAATPEGRGTSRAKHFSAQNKSQRIAFYPDCIQIIVKFTAKNYSKNRQ
jgi:hypothetical protein